ncbi:hypothetical protein EMPS_02091 [Entomortierella parvispora]|uniref:Uncharacterized protein n=1 Tax=Entomortierella parvispora TaxID=205924 RepID=A0A9P3LT79_9FUNG|nr:hypothetical protein EMPS_02091 [Entomortierella parvispora]
MVKLASHLTVIALVALFSVATQVEGQSGRSIKREVASQPSVDLILVKRDGTANQKLTIPRDTCHFMSYGVWMTLSSVKIVSPNTSCAIYQDENCKLEIQQGTTSVGVGHKANTIRCTSISQQELLS